MKIKQGIPLLVTLFAGAGMFVVSLPVVANVAAECRQEAEEYGIPPEQMEDYVTGCVLSRGGEYVQEPAVQDPAGDTAPEYGLPDESGATDAAGMGDNYQDDAVTGGENLPE